MHNEVYVVRPYLSPQWGMQPGAVPNSLSFGLEEDTDIPPIGTYWAQVAFTIIGVEKLPKLLHDNYLGVRLPIILSLHIPLHLSRSAVYAAIRIPLLVLFFCRKLHPDGSGCHPLEPFHMLLQLSKI